MRFTRFATAFLVEDVAATRDFFVQHLGCTAVVDLGWYVDLGHGSSPEFVLDFVAHDHPSMPEGLRGRTAAGALLAFVVDDAEALAAELRAAGVPLLAECRDEPWGQRHFFARTPGPVVEFVQPIAPDPEWAAANGL